MTATKQSLLIVILSVMLSVVSATIVTFSIDRQRDPRLPDVIRARKLELVDAEGNVRGTFALVDDTKGDVSPEIIMRDADGRDSIVMGVDQRGFGVLSFGSDRWNEGAVRLGHVTEPSDTPGSHEQAQEYENSYGAWGLMVRSRESKRTGVGFFNSGKPITPMSSESDRNPR